MCTEELDVDEPLLDDDDEPLLPDEDEEEDDVVLSSSLSTSRFLRGLSLTPPRRGLSLMPRPSISLCGYWVFMVAGSRGMVLGLPRASLGGASLLSGWCRQHSRGAGAGKAWPTGFP